MSMHLCYILVKTISEILINAYAKLVVIQAEEYVLHRVEELSTDDLNLEAGMVAKSVLTEKFKPIKKTEITGIKPDLTESDFIVIDILDETDALDKKILPVNYNSIDP